jgi:hypothetical protein
VCADVFPTAKFGLQSLGSLYERKYTAIQFQNLNSKDPQVAENESEEEDFNDD